MPDQRRFEKTCEDCNVPNQETWLCDQCDVIYCNGCWDRAVPHRKNRRDTGSIPHEKTDYFIASRLKNILSPNEDPEEQRKLHDRDVDTAWFGVERNNANMLPKIRDYGRFPQLMQESYTDREPERWPQIVSVIGETGEGKSSVINMLVDQALREMDFEIDADKFSKPVVGPVSSPMPTSGDVHLYADPRSFYTKYPKLFADSEGFNGGEKPPAGDRTNANPAYLPNGARKGRRFWDLQWATDTPTRRRGYAVRHLYPRFLHTFSDVVVYVLQNERTFEAKALSHLLEWASTSIESSVNQPALPHAIIVMNKADRSLPDWAWDVNQSTTRLLTELDPTIHTESALSKYMDYLKRNGKEIKTTQELVKSYYSSIRVVRIPEKGRYMQMDRQIQKLYEEIHSCCERSHAKKRRHRLDQNADELAHTLLAGFKHFSNNLNRPFDFVALSWSLNPIPKDFTGNILRLARVITELRPAKHPAQIFECLSEMVASCVMLDLIRHRIKGLPEQLLKHYKSRLDEVVRGFCKSCLRCNYKLRNRECQNVFNGHAKGHQDAQGRPFGTGPYQSDFTADTYLDKWNKLLLRALEKMQREINRAQQVHKIQEIQAANDCHLQRMNKFYQSFETEDIDRFSSHSACFSCLRELPEHPLPCGHVLCTPCVQAHGQERSSISWDLSSCPMHTKNSRWINARIKVKPALAGVRVLCLDGGGMRGIVQLLVLSAIERQLGGIPIQEFFDLIVGTSAGGINALGLGVKKWPIQDCIQQFRQVSHSAFTPHTRIPVLGLIALLRHGAKYNTQPLEDGLRESLGDDLLFGGRFQTERSSQKVAVVSATEEGPSPVLLANYNRAQTEKTRWRFERPEDVRHEFKIWEAGLATSAAPPLFKPFVNERSDVSYLDGALFYNNPVLVAEAERKLLWPDVSEAPVDFMLSLGTGCNKAVLDQERAKRQTNNKSTNSDEEASPIDSRKRYFSGKLPRFVQILKDRIYNMLDTQSVWDQYRTETLGDSSRYMRFNLPIRDLPHLDEVDKMATLEDEVWRYLDTNNDIWMDIKHTVWKLLASSFYFDKRYTPALEACVTGNIRCRFEGDEKLCRLFTERLRQQKCGTFRPYFTVTVVEDDGSTRELERVCLPKDFFTKLRRGICSIDPFDIICETTGAQTTIALRFDRYGETYPISGFPRQLLAEDALLDSREKERRAARQRIHSQTYSASSQENTPRSSAFSDSLHELSAVTSAHGTPSMNQFKEFGYIYRNASQFSQKPYEPSTTSSDSTENSSEYDFTNHRSPSFVHNSPISSKQVEFRIDQTPDSHLHKRYAELQGSTPTTTEESPRGQNHQSPDSTKTPLTARIDSSILDNYNAKVPISRSSSGTTTALTVETSETDQSSTSDESVPSPSNQIGRSIPRLGAKRNKPLPVPPRITIPPARPREPDGARTPNSQGSIARSSRRGDLSSSARTPRGNGFVTDTALDTVTEDSPVHSGLSDFMAALSYAWETIPKGVQRLGESQARGTEIEAGL